MSPRPERLRAARARARTGTGLLAAAVLLALAAGPAAAHTELESARPGPGEVLVAAPSSVRLVFNEPVQEGLAQVVVTGPGGRLTQGTAQSDGAVVTQPVPAGGGPGAYTLAYRVVADDGHPVTGELSFTVSAPPAVTAGGGAASTPAESPAAAPSPAPAPAGAEQRAVWPWAAGALAGLALVGAGLRSRARRR